MIKISDKEYFSNDKRINFLNVDCVEFMKSKPDNYYDLAIVDPPYGITGNLEIGFGDKKSGRINRPNKWGQKEWDSERPTQLYFDELFRVSKNQIIWGGNYFADILPKSEKWLVWDKMQRVNQSDCELAYTSYKGALRVFQFHCSNLQGFRNPNRFHPTEKPVELYNWILKDYAKTGFKILDTHGGSMGSAIACDMGGYNLDICEIDLEYFQKSIQRFKAYRKDKEDIKEFGYAKTKINAQNPVLF